MRQREFIGLLGSGVAGICAAVRCLGSASGQADFMPLAERIAAYERAANLTRAGDNVVELNSVDHDRRQPPRS